MFRPIFVLTVILAFVLAACGGRDESRGPAGPPGPTGISESSGLSGTTGKGSTVGAGAPAPSVGSSSTYGDTFVEGTSQLQTAQRQVISRANVSVEVPVVNTAMTQIRATAESLGGFIENMNSGGDIKLQQASATIRVPQINFFTALERIEVLGKVLGRNVTTEDVSERFIDLDARLKSAQREEESLLSLLSKATAVSDVLTIERELTRVRAEVERLQGQLNFLQRRVDLATISVTLQQSGKLVEPPSAALEIEVSDAPVTVAEIKGLVTVMKGVVDNVTTFTKDGETTASMTLRVFSADFDRMVKAIEGKGDVDLREIREGKIAADSVQPDEPDARIVVTMVEEDPWWPEALKIGGAIAGGLIVLAAIGLFLGMRTSKR